VEKRYYEKKASKNEEKPAHGKRNHTLHQLERIVQLPPKDLLCFKKRKAGRRKKASNTA